MDSFETPYEEDSEYIECTVSLLISSRLDTVQVTSTCVCYPGSET